MKTSLSLFVFATTLLAQSPGIRHIPYHRGMAPTVYTQLNWQTLIVVPEGEHIARLGVVCGDCDVGEKHLNNFADYAGDNFVAIKATRKAAQTDLHLVMQSGNIYSFVVVEVSKTATQPDIQVIIEPTDAATLEAISGKRSAPDILDGLRSQVISEQQAQEVTALRQQLEESRSAAQARAQTEAVPTDVRYDYRYKLNASGLPFNLQKIGHSDRFTYIWANPAEAFTVYEIQDGKPNLVPIKPHNGYYLIETVIQKGELVIGKRRLQFKREG